VVSGMMMPPEVLDWLSTHLRATRSWRGRDFMLGFSRAADKPQQGRSLPWGLAHAARMVRSFRWIQER
jgi:hypothetical protein